ncbi:sensor histidine kinase [Streptosporangiaceae bacterium NEAU-GS5]|nr:sensor histidine kinase [Streptosporangiaceae bacterium NEAU-GS5]
MAHQNRSIRFKLYSLLSLPIVTLIALWTLATGHTVGDAFELMRSHTLIEQVSTPATNLATQIQIERQLSAVFVSSDAPDAGKLADARVRTDDAIKLFRQRTGSMEGQSAETPEVSAAAAVVLTQTSKLGEVRRAVTARAVSRVEAVAAYNTVVDSLFRLSDVLVTVPEIRLYQQAGGLQRIAQARDVLSREDALISGAALKETLPAEDHEALEDLIPNRRLLLDQGLSVLDRELRAPFDTLLSSDDYRRLTDAEAYVTDKAALPDNDTFAWRALADSLGATFDRLVADRTRLLNTRTDSAGTSVVTQIVVTGGVGLLAILLAVALSARLGRGLATELALLRSAALELANGRLPRLVGKLKEGDMVDVDTEAPPLTVSGNTQEIQDVGDAFSTVQRTAVEAAVGQAELRRGISHVFRNLARRNQSLLHRQLTQLDQMQRKTTVPDALEDLFRLDHLTTRMRRQAEGLIILSGANAGRSWRRPVPFMDVIRGAVAEVEDYTRVTVLPMPDAALLGATVADVIHLLAELVENATIFSPPNTKVTIRGELVGRGFAIEIEDRGLGLTTEERDDVNRRLSLPPEFDLAVSDRLGLFVVGQLAARHDVKVSLQRSPYGGTTAVVLIPDTVISAWEPLAELTAEVTE